MSSLTAMALRFAARRALDGATFAEDRVHDSSIAPVDHMIEGGDDAAFIVVSTEDEATTVIGRDINSAERTIDIVFQVAIAHSGTGEDDGGDILIPATDAGLELSLTLIVRQALRALFEGASPWSTVFKRFAPTVKKITNQRGVGNKENGRFAARLLILTVSPLHEPPFGLVLGEDGPWAELLALMEADAELGALAPLVRQAITGTPEIPAWDRGRADQGLMIEEAQNIGIGAKFLPGEEPALATEGTLEVTPDE